MRRVHVTLSDDTGLKLDKWVKEANEGFDEGHVTHSDCVEFVISQGSVNIDQLRRKKVKLSRLLVKTAKSSSIDIDALISQLRSFRDATQKGERKSGEDKK